MQIENVENKILHPTAAAGLNIAIIMSRFNQEITSALCAGAERALQELGGKAVQVIEVPGALEIPFVVQALSKKMDAIVCLGAVIKGETAHFEYVCEGFTYGIMQVSLQSRIPVANGVLTTYNHDQALARAGNDNNNKGYEAARVAVEMALLAKRL